MLGYWPELNTVQKESEPESVDEDSLEERLNVAKEVEV